MGPTLTHSVVLGTLLSTMGCGASGLGPSPSTPRIDYVDGALEPVLVRGETAVFEGFGFGDSQATGSVRFTTPSGSAMAAVASDGWSDRFVRVLVPDSATSGTATVLTAKGLTLTTSVHVLPRRDFDPAALSWVSRTPLPKALVGVALATGTSAFGEGLRVTAYATGGAEPSAGGSTMSPDSAVFVASVAAGGLLSSWSRHRDLPEPRAFAAAVLANRFNSRFGGTALYVIGGIDSTGRARATVFQSLVSNDTVVAPFTTIEPLPMPVAGAEAVVHQGCIYVVGGTDSLGSPQSTVYVGRVGENGHIDGWYPQPALPAPRAYGGAVVLDDRIVAFGGLADSAPIGGGLTLVPPRSGTADTAQLSQLSGFFTGTWAPAGTLLPVGRSQFAELRLGDVILLVGGVYAAVGSNGAETLSAQVLGDSLAAFQPVGAGTIAALGGGTLVGAGSASWQDVDGSHHGIVLGGIDFATQAPQDGVWGF